jgi:hypothetical protein
MRWFGRKSADVPPMFLSYAIPSERSLFPTGYQAQLKEVFLGNPLMKSPFEMSWRGRHTGGGRGVLCDLTQGSICGV